MKSGQSVSELLNPPPPSFRRVPPADTARTPFPIMVLVSEGSTIDKGFMYVAPDSTLSPHPFTTRDVNEHDWRQFLHDVRMAGTLSPMNVVMSAMVPLATGVGIIMPMLMFSGMQKLQRNSKVRGPVSQLIDYWNNFFFHPRCMHVSLTQGPPKFIPSPDNGVDKSKWRLVISYRPAYMNAISPSPGLSSSETVFK
ncbi:hypothetical protein C8Q76DRAFT_632006 [Earliella scabrosa]|nr:hypothetical protein C8Q76DRAFT_632006 [Earliella scabrosa]